MRVRKLLGKRTKEQPADAFMASHIFLLRGGYIRQVSNGIYTLLPPARRIAAKLEAVIREEMEGLEGQEVLFPVVLPAELWRESGRYDAIGSELMRLRDRAGRDLCLGMTHEEAAVHLVRSEVQSYAELPLMVYQIQTKFRDEPRSRAGLIRVREFTMKDAYSFHTSQEDLEEYYGRVLAAYEAVYRRVGLENVCTVRSDSGMMGGSTAHEFMYLSPDGEDTLALCRSCGYRSNLEVAVCGVKRGAPGELPLEKRHTPGVTAIEELARFFSVEESRLIKAAVFAREGTDRPLVVFTRGDYQVSEAKLKRLLGREAVPYEDDGKSGLCLGFVGPVGLDGAVDMLFDRTLEGEENLICGANEADYHLSGVSLARDVGPVETVDVHKVRDGDACPRCGGPLAVENGIEVGNIFQLGDKYTRSMGMTYTDRDGVERHPVMGCYGIGIGRLLACILEEHHDENGPVWPVQVAPWQVHICVIGSPPPEAVRMGERLYEQMSREFEVLLDDRDVSAGIQFADADLLGAPLRVIVGGRNWKNGEVELALRDKSLVKKVKAENAAEEIRGVMAELCGGRA